MSFLASPLLALTSLFFGAAQQDGAAARERGEELYRQDRLLEAEKYFSLALSTLPEAEHAPVYDRLLNTYIRLGRLDRALRTGASYETWLRAHPPADRLRLLYYEMGWCYFMLGHLAPAEQHFSRALAANNLPPLPAEKKLAALLYLATAAERGSDPAKARRCWRDLEIFAQECLALPNLSATLRAESVWKLAESYRMRQQRERAAAQLRQLLEAPLGAAERRQTFQALARDLVALKDAPGAEKALREAIRLHEELPEADKLTLGDLAAQLCLVLKEQKRREDADRWRERAAEAYKAVLKDPRLGRPFQAGALEAFWKLQQLYQEEWQLQSALQLLAAPPEHWAGPTLLEPKLKAEAGQLGLALGALRQAREHLGPAVAQMEQQSPPDLHELPRAYLNRGTAELMTGGIEEGARLAEKGLKLYRQYRLNDDPILVDLHNLFGASATQTGDFAAALQRYGAGLAVCDRLGPAAASQRCNLLLNIALLHRAQGDLDEALRLCERAQRAYEVFVEPESLNLAVFLAARINLQWGRDRAAEAFPLVEPLLKLCQKHGIKAGPLVVTARHLQAARALAQREYAAAEQTWREVLALQEQEQDTPLLPRTLNFLGITADLQGQRREAEAYFRRALAQQQQNPRAYPTTHFITLWRLAEIVAASGDRTEARRLLEQGLQVADRSRQKIVGDIQKRAANFAQFAPGCDRQVEWCVAEHDPAAALAVHLRGRGRALLEHLQGAGLDPRAGLPPGPERDKLLRREAELRQKTSALRAQAWGLALGPDEGDTGARRLKEYEAAREEYARVWYDIQIANPGYRPLADELGAPALARLRAELPGPGTRLLVYHLGMDRSYLFLIGETIRAFELTVPEDVAREAVAPPAPTAAQVLGGGRGLTVKTVAPSQDPPVPPAARRVPLTYETAGVLIDHYRLRIADPAFEPTRGLGLRTRAGFKPLPPQRAELLGEVFLPAAARAQLRAEAPPGLLVIPDGPLHRLPLEAILLESGATPRYVLDELPPLTYAPSLAVVRWLLERSREPVPPDFALLTVCDPAYPEAKDLPKRVGGLQLPRLPFTAVESRNISSYFDTARVTTLAGTKATEKAVVGQVAGKQVLHLAVHGYADEEFGNLFGALALTTQGRNDHADDGFLELHEIYTLPLRDCQLAVLSACVTNVGPQPPLEAGVTLASGFLAAGARRVVASHWSVDDAATAELMGAFFKTLTQAQRQRRPIRYARALQEGRLQLRRQTRTAAPFYWAPFVLIGPPEAASR